MFSVLYRFKGGTWAQLVRPSPTLGDARQRLRELLDQHPNGNIERAYVCNLDKVDDR